MKERWIIAVATFKLCLLLPAENALAETISAVPENLKTSITEVITFEAHGEGVQIMSAKPAQRIQHVLNGSSKRLKQSYSIMQAR